MIPVVEMMKPNKRLDMTQKLHLLGFKRILKLFALFSSLCEQKVSAYMPSWALLGMTAVM
jgi:hypothetical protein